MSELANWKMLSLKEWRERHGYTTPEWISYRDAMNTQNAIFTVCFSILSYLLGYTAR